MLFSHIFNDVWVSIGAQTYQKFLRFNNDENEVYSGARTEKLFPSTRNHPQNLDILRKNERNEVSGIWIELFRSGFSFSEILLEILFSQSWYQSCFWKNNLILCKKGSSGFGVINWYPVPRRFPFVPFDTIVSPCASTGTTFPHPMGASPTSLPLFYRHTDARCPSLHTFRKVRAPVYGTIFLWKGVVCSKILISCTELDHPSTWIVFSTNGKFSQNLDMWKIQNIPIYSRNNIFF